LITVDALRPDRLSAYGYSSGRTPFLDWLAGGGVRFRNAFCDVPWTTPSLASVLTGRYPPRHGVHTAYERLPERETTLAEVLRAQGYRTAAIVGSFRADPAFGLAQGFEHYDARFDASIIESPVRLPKMRMRFFGSVRRDLGVQLAKSRADSYRTDAAVADAAIGWLRRTSRMRPFFLWVHFYGPNSKVQPGGSLEDVLSRALQRYDDDVTALDAQIGRLLHELGSLGWLQRTLIVVHASHGQSLLEHGYFGYGKYLYDPALRVPLILWFGRRLPGGRQTGALARNIDIVPTILDFIGIPPPRGFDGVSLRRVALGIEETGARDAYCETRMAASLQVAPPRNGGSSGSYGFYRWGLRTERWKYIRSEPRPLIEPPGASLPAEVQRQAPTEQLFDLGRDPGEIHDVAGAHPDVVAELRARLQEIAGDFSSGAVQPPARG